MSKWIEHGIIFRPNKKFWWSKSHATLPFPLFINKKIIRIYLNCFDKNKISRPGFIDVLAENPKKVVFFSQRPILDLGRPGCFDDNGVMSSSFLKKDNRTMYMYYVGFEKCDKVRYRLFTGLAISKDRGLTFKRYQENPILDRNSDEQFFRCAPFCLREGSKYKLWYVGGNGWIKVKGKLMPKYKIKYCESNDGVNWPKRGTTVLKPTKGEAYSLGRPFLYKNKNNLKQMLYSKRNISSNQYSIGYAIETKNYKWKKKDGFLKIGKTKAGEGLHAQMYASIVQYKNRQYMFYNGKNFGVDGLKFAEKLND